MKKNYKKQINKKDLISFNDWCNKNGVFLLNSNFLTQFININSKTIFSDSYIEFFLYNKLVLKNKYNLNFSDFLFNIKKTKLDEMIIEILKFRFKENYKYFEDLIPFIEELNNYKKINKKNNDYEILILKIYWKFIEKIEKSKLKYFNKWVIFINKMVYDPYLEKGFKR